MSGWSGPYLPYEQNTGADSNFLKHPQYFNVQLSLARGDANWGVTGQQAFVLLVVVVTCGL